MNPVEPADGLSLRYVPLSQLPLWEGNAKLHDLPAIRTSIERYGFKDPPKWEALLNDGRGGAVEGNGRLEVLAQMHQENRPAPRGIGVDERSGEWFVPVLYGVDGADQVEAMAYGVDHNWLTVMPLSAEASLGIWDLELLAPLAQLLGDRQPVSLSGIDLLDLLTQQPPDAGPDDEGQGERSTGESTKRLRITMAEPETAVEEGQVYRLLGRHMLLVVDLVTGVDLWHDELTIARQRAAEAELEVLFCPYPDPLVPNVLRAKTSILFLVQPDPYIAGHLLDQLVRIHGEDAFELVR